jgi:hypothetical protein
LSIVPIIPSVRWAVNRESTLPRIGPDPLDTALPRLAAADHGERTLADMTIDRLAPTFGRVPVVLMAGTEHGSPRHYGNRDNVTSLGTVPVDQMPWKTKVEKLNSDREMGVFHNSAIRIGDVIYGGNRTFYGAYDLKAGKTLWKHRGLSEANTIRADGKMIVLDENGKLALATVSPDGMKVHSEIQLPGSRTWTPPTLTGTMLIVRGNGRLIALELKTQPSKELESEPAMLAGPYFGQKPRAWSPGSSRRRSSRERNLNGRSVSSSLPTTPNSISPGRTRTDRSISRTASGCGLKSPRVAGVPTSSCQTPSWSSSGSSGVTRPRSARATARRTALLFTEPPPHLDSPLHAH